MLGKRIINTATGAACTTDTVQILDGVPFQSIATYELDGNAESSVKTGYIGNAAEFNGSSSYIDTGISSFSSEFSFSFWMQGDSLGGGSMFGNWNATSANDFYINTNSSGQLILGIDGIGNQTFGSSGDISANTWHHIVVTFNNGTVEGYLDGASLGTSTTGNTSFSSGLNFTIGADSTRYNSSHFSGKIDQFRIFNKALSSSEVTTLYGETSASSTKSTTDIFADSSGISLYELESNANDTSGTNNGTATNVVYGYDGTASNVTYSTGKFGQAGVFNGSSSYIDLGSTIDNPLRTEGAFGASLWFNADSYGSNSVIFKLLNDTYIYIFLNTSNQLECRVVNSSDVASIITFGVSLNTWYHIVWTGNSTNGVTLYVNGSSIGNAAWDGTFLTYTNTTYKHNYLGYNGGNVGWYNGSIDQVRIYDKAISAADVTTLYNETVATASTNITLEAPSLVAYYKMNDATDETGSYDGTPTNVNFNVAGKFGNAGEFNGSSSYINLPNTLIPNQVQKTISLWVYPNVHTSESGAAIILAVYDQISIYYNTSNQFEIIGGRQSNNAYINFSNVAKSPNQWYHIAISKTNSNISLYIDGSLIQTVGYDGTLSVQNYFNRIGTNNTSSPFKFTWNGKIDQVRVFDRAITSDEVETLYNEVYCQPTIVPTDHFEPVIYTGNGTTQSISTLDFQPDLVWIKNRPEVTNHQLVDSVRGFTNGGFGGDSTYSSLSSNTTSVENTNSSNFQNYGYLKSLDSDGFTVVFGTGHPADSYNKSGDSHVAWNWKAGGAAVSNTDGTITSQVSANVDAGFSIVSYTGNGTAGATIGHGLNEAPELIITKNRDESQSWIVNADAIGKANILTLNNTGGALSRPNQYYYAWDSSTLTTGSDIHTNGLNDKIITYCFHSVDGMSKIGSYVGTGASSNSIVTGFRPAYVMIKKTSGTSRWRIVDNKRDIENPRSKNLFAEDSIAETGRPTHTTQDFNFHSNGFEIPANMDGELNQSGASFIFMAFAEENVEPQPVLANSFNTVTYTGNGGTQAINTVGFQPDLVWIKSRSSASWAHFLQDSVRGVANFLISNSTGAEATTLPNIVGSFDTNGFTVLGNGNSNNLNDTYVAWCWKASNESTINQEGSISSVVSANPAAGFSVVSYSSTGTNNTTVGHGLSSAPELIFFKKRTNTGDWITYSQTTGADKYLFLNRTDGQGNATGLFNNINENTFNLISGYNDYNQSGQDYIAYAFHSVDGYQKVGSYTGNATTNVVTTGFQPKFLLVKASSHASSWYVIDSERTDDKFLSPNSSNAEYTDANKINFTSTGFTLTSTSYNNSGYTWIYLAIA